MQRTLVRTALVAALAVGTWGSTAAAQQAVLQGHVVDATTGQPLIGAQITVTGTDRGAVTDVDGLYRLDLAPGRYDLQVVYLGYTDKTVTGVVVAAVGTNWQDVALKPEAISAEAIRVVISAEDEKGSVVGALARQRNATNVVNGISAEEIGRAPASNAADAIKRVTSTSIVAGKYVYVRGLGERYSTAQLDGSTLPTPEPEKRVLPLDLFPASMIESLFTVKSYTADLPGDFAGGLVDIRTKDIPDRAFLNVSTGVGYHSNLGALNRPTYAGGGLDWLGIDDGTRGLPSGFPSRIPASATAADRAALHSELGGDWQAYQVPFGLSDMDASLGISFGDRVDWFGKQGGYLVGLSYNRTADARTQRELYPSRQTDVLQYDYSTALGTRDVSIGAMGGYALNPTPTSRVSVKTIFTQSGEDETRLVSGPFDQSTQGYARIRRFQFVQRSLLSNQVKFEHKAGLLGDDRVEWNGSWALALRNEPDTRQSAYVAAAPEGPYVFNEAGNNSRFFSDLTDHMGQGGVKMTSQFDLFGRRATLETGAHGSYRTRHFEARRFSYEEAASDLRALPPSELLTTENVAAGNIDFLDVTEPNDTYDGTETGWAGFGSLGFGIDGAVRATVGLRVEGNRTEVRSFDPRTGSRVRGLSADLSTIEPLPSVTLQWNFADGQAIRAAGSRTIVRPQFRELAPFRYDNYLESTLGNPFLKNGSIYNWDLRWSWFPTIGEIVSVGGFYKSFKDPIEVVRIPTIGNNVGSPEPYNGPSAQTYGAEIEVRGDLGRVISVSGLGISANATFARSKVRQDVPVDVYFGAPTAEGPNQLSPEVFTSASRPLAFQSPYLLNGSLFYTSPAGGTAATLLYNGVGKRLTQVGTNGYADIYEQARHTLDVSVDQRVMDAIRLKLAVSNLTDAPVRYRLGDYTTLRYQPGRTVSLKASYAF